MKYILFFTLLYPFLLFSQLEIKGKVIDSIGSQVIKGALIMAIRVKDSTLVNFTRTNSLGEYKLQNLPIDTFQIVIGHSKFDDNQIFVFLDGKENKIELPPSTLLKKAKELKEIVIHANNTPIYFKGDTLVYVADSFKVKERAVVEDLLKKLPGVKVDINGKITYQGKNVDRMYVDGDEFFGKDPTIATKNLEAAMIDQVQVYEEGANSDKVMNLTLKEDAKKGTFGKSSLASDGKKFYEGEILFNKYRKKENFALYGLKNNTPRSGFDYQDAESVNSNKYSYNLPGFPDNLQTGINYKNNFGKSNKHKVKVGYTLDVNTIKNQTTTSTINFIGDSTITSNSLDNQTDKKSNHNIFLEYNWTIDSLTKLSIKPTYWYKESKLDNENISSFLNNKQITYRNSSRNYTDSSIYNSFFNTTFFEKNYYKKGRRSYFNHQYSYNDQTTINNTLFNSTDVLNLNSKFDQNFENKNVNYKSKSEISHSEPVFNDFILSTSFKSNFSNENQKQLTFDRFFNSLKMIDTLSSDFQSKIYNNEYELAISYKKKNHYFSLNNVYNSFNMINLNINSNKSYAFDYKYFLPEFNYYYYKRSNSIYISMTANKTINYPKVNQLQPVLSNRNPNYRSIGNPNLKPSISNNIEFRIYKSLDKMGEYFNFNLNSKFLESDFVESISYNNLGVSTSQTINVNGVHNHSISSLIRKYIYKDKIALNSSLSNQYYVYQTMINSVQTKTEQLSFEPNLGIDYYTDSFMLSFSNATTYYKPIGSIYNNSAGSYFTITNTLSFDWTPKFLGVQIKGDLNQSITTGRATGYNLNRTLLNFSIIKELLKSKNLKISLEINDILNQNKGINRVQILNQITDTKSNIISRFILFRITYRFLKSNTANT